MNTKKLAVVVTIVSLLVLGLGTMYGLYWSNLFG